jgi:hypothetical protein
MLARLQQLLLPSLLLGRQQRHCRVHHQRQQQWLAQESFSSH